LLNYSVTNLLYTSDKIVLCARMRQSWTSSRSFTLPDGRELHYDLSKVELQLTLGADRELVWCVVIASPSLEAQRDKGGYEMKKFKEARIHSDGSFELVPL
jgi:hypothetical protein